MRPGADIVLVNFPVAESTRGTVVIRTRYEDIGLEQPAPREVCFEVTLPAQSIDDALAMAIDAAGLATILAFTANTAVNDMQVHLAYEVTPEVVRRPLREYAGRAQQDIPWFGRFVDNEAFFQVLKACNQGEMVPRLGSAISAYQSALDYWHASSRLLSLAHLYMACDALTECLARLHRKRLDLSEEDHARALGVVTSTAKCSHCNRQSGWRYDYLAAVRREYLFGNDESLYRTARKASDGFEHGYIGLPTLREDAALVTGKLFVVVRKGLLDVMGLDEAVRARIEGLEPVDVRGYAYYVEASLTGKVEDPRGLAAVGERHPRMNVETSVGELTYEGTALRMSLQNKTTPLVAAGIDVETVESRSSGGLNSIEMFRSGVHWPIPSEPNDDQERLT